MRLASYNVENLFERAKALNRDTWSEGRPVLEAFSALNTLLCKENYSNADKTKIVALLEQLGLSKSDAGPFVLLRQNKGKLLKRPKTGGLQIVANGRDEWIGWIELKKEPVNERAAQNTGQVIRDLNADVLAVIEAEDRTALRRFGNAVLEGVGGQVYKHVMLIDGNDERGIDVGLCTRAAFPIQSIRSHVEDEDAKGVIFSRDCPEYCLETPGGEHLWVLVNHLKSKGFGVASESNARRTRQAKRVRALYENLIAVGETLVAVVGDFNDTPDSEPLHPLLSSSLRDISTHPNFDDGAGGARPGTYGNGTASNKIDYVLLSPVLFSRASGGGIFRRGVWGGTQGTLWEHYPEMERAEHAASDHAAIWADIDL
jgi:endonuclease/exonuclease/phosphatase family metal-dependent hydrolase